MDINDILGSEENIEKLGKTIGVILIAPMDDGAIGLATALMLTKMTPLGHGVIAYSSEDLSSEKKSLEEMINNSEFSRPIDLHHIIKPYNPSDYPVIIEKKKKPIDAVTKKGRNNKRKW